jgi:YkoY family integral membrane protein
VHDVLHVLQLDSFRGDDLLVVGVVIVLHCLLSFDNAVVLALMVRDLPRDQQGPALRWGLFGAYIFRAVALALAVWIMGFWFLKVLGGAYLVFLAVRHFRRRGRVGSPAPRLRIPWFPVFWSTVVAVELVDIVFSVDSIAATIALSTKLWILVLGSSLGILAMRLAAQGFIGLLTRFPRLVSAAFTAVGVIGALLVLEIPVDALGLRAASPADAAYGTAEEYECVAHAAARRALDLPRVIVVNLAAPPPPSFEVMRREQLRRAEALPAGEREARAESAAREQHRLAYAAWTLHYRPLLDVESWLVSLTVIAMFIAGFSRRARPEEVARARERMQAGHPDAEA